MAKLGRRYPSTMRSVQCVAMRPTGPPVTIGSTSGGVEPYHMGHYSKITSRAITEEGRVTLEKMSNMMRQWNDPIKPTPHIKGHKFG